MKYVFFDIECACVYKNVAKICVFGYVVTNERFEVTEREDILINPNGKFHLTDRKGKEGLVLPYDYADFKKYPNFRAVYPRIRELLEGKDTFVFGHATDNDVKYLNLETRRYKLPSLYFRFYDTQFFYMNCENAFSKQIGLQAMAERLGVEYTPHRAVDDSYATMRVCEALCKREHTDVSGLIARYKIVPGSLKNYTIRLQTSARLDEYHRVREKKKAEQSRARAQFFRFVNKHMNRRKKGGSLDGKAFCFSKEIEEDMPLAEKLLVAIFASGGAYTSRPSQCDVYIAHDDSGMRCERALSSGAAFIPLDSLQSVLGNDGSSR